MNGVINVLKPPGMTSHDVVGAIRRIYRFKKVGHAGTLDPGAAGVLPVFLGSATRLIEYFSEDDKSYRAWVTFGAATDTGDDTGTVISKIDSFTLPDAPELEKTLASFLGSQEQVPPMYSAIKVAGKKLYELARSGVTVERQPRPVTIHDLKLLKREETRILIDVVCSKGTYIRTLCQDIGERLNVPATMSFLVRLRAGDFKLADAWSLEEIAANQDKVCLNAADFLKLPLVKLDAQSLLFFQTGRKSIVDCQKGFNGSTVKITDWQDRFAGIGGYTKNADNTATITPVKVMSGE
ncbi:MAG: tRNA pseudouridine(55) synthase TruB [Sporomusaceae bacterium]|jgi:tRNA pseudouridine55 synthase|nr:tRNA pseudouridine(55) synthase TruB [Sporomusaceae bacterium]